MSNSNINRGVGCLDQASLEQIDADCCRGFSAALPSHQRALRAHLAAGAGAESAAYARALLLRVEQLLQAGMVGPNPTPLAYLDETLVLDLGNPLPVAA